MLGEVNVLLILAIILGVGTLSGSLAKWLHLPSITGQILAGVLIGPAVFGIFSDESLHMVDPMVDFALGLMAVAVGSHLNFRRLHVARRRLITLLILEATLTPLLVFSGVMLFSDTMWYTALLLATIAISTAPATVLALVKETASKGGFVTTLIAAVALNNLVCIILFELARTLARAAISPTAATLPASLVLPVGQIVASLVLGLLVGSVLIFFTRHVSRSDRLTVKSVIAILLTTGLTEYLGLSVLLACLSLGVTLSNVTPDKEEIGHRVFDSFETAIFAVFFMVAGMELHLQSLLLGGLLVAIAFGGRLSGKILAGYLGMKLAGAPARLRRWIGASLIPQAGLAVGLMLLITEDPAFESIREVFLAVVLGMVLLNESVGPILTRLALKNSGDFGRDRARVLDFLSEHNITTDLTGRDKESAIRQLVEIMIRTNHLKIDKEALIENVLQSEGASFCMGDGLALPHARVEFGHAIVGAMGISREGLLLDAPDKRPVHCMVLIVAPDSMQERYIEVLKALTSTIGLNRTIQQQLYHIDSPAHADELIHLGQQFEDWNYYLED